MNSPNPQKRSKWLRWLKHIESELIHLLGSRQIYKSYGKIVQNNRAVNEGGPLFHNWVIDNYVTFVAMAIRRQADTDNDSISLARLLADIRDNPESLERSWHVNLYKDSIAKGGAEDIFTKYAGSKSCIDPRLVERDLAKLLSLSDKISRLATRSIAHKTTRPIPKVTFNDVDECVDGIKEIARKYIILLTASDNVLEPVMDDWSNIFTIRWIK